MAYDTSSSQGYAAASGSDSGGPFQNSASIFFGTAEIGGSTLTNTPNISPSATAKPSAALGDIRGTDLPAAGSVGSSLFSPLFFVGALLVGGALIVHMVKHKPA